MRATAVIAALIGAGTLVAGGPSQAHNDWALPLLGGAVGGFALKSFMSKEQAPKTTYVEPVYAVPPPPPPRSSTSSVEARLRELDALAANGYITHDEYEQRRQAILNGI